MAPSSQRTQRSPQTSTTLRRGWPCKRPPA
jgi:hypothetical protein